MPPFSQYIYNYSLSMWHQYSVNCLINFIDFSLTFVYYLARNFEFPMMFSDFFTP